MNDSESKIAPALVEGRDRTGPFVILCDHASNRFPEKYSGISEYEMLAKEHVSWDPGALPVARKLAKTLNAPLVYSTVSRLVIDCNRKKSAPDLVPAKTERGFVAANTDLDEAEIIYRYDEFHAPFHNLVGSVLQDRGKECVVVSIHSYTQEFNGETRDFEVGILHDTDRRLGAVLFEELTSLAEYDVRENEPYSAADGVYYTLDRHAQTQGRPCVMIEIRNDQVDTEAQQKNWANLLSTSLTTAQNIISQNTSLQRSPSL